MSIFRKPAFHVFISLFVPAVLWALVSFVNHACYRTYALDLGMMNQALFQFSNGTMPMFTQGMGEEMPFLCDHFSPILWLLVPFHWLFGSYALLVVQWIALLTTGWLFCQWVYIRWGNHTLAIAAIWLWAGSFGVWGAVSYDMHTNVLLACGMAALLYCSELGKLWACWCIAVLMLCCKETGGLIAACMTTALAIQPGQSRNLRNGLLFLSAFTLLGFFLTLMWWMPAQCGGMKAASHMTYAHLGGSWGEIAWNGLTHPIDTLRLFYEKPDGSLARTKVVSWLILFLGGAWACWIAPRYLLVFFPLVLLRFFSANPLFWDVQAHYSIELAVLLTVFLVHFFGRFQAQPFSRWMVWLMVLFGGYLSWRVVIGRTEQSHFASVRHYQSVYSDPRLMELIDQTGSDPLCTISNLCPHAAERDGLTVFPNLGRAKWILLDKAGCSTFPLSAEAYQDQMLMLRNHADWKISIETDQFVLFAAAATK
jgi:hypothetical protein